MIDGSLQEAEPKNENRDEEQFKQLVDNENDDGCIQRWPRDEYTHHSPCGTHFVVSQTDIELVRRATRRASAKYPRAHDESLKVFYLSKRGEEL